MAEEYPLATVLIPKYKIRIQTAKKRRKKYYKEGDDLPKTYTPENGYKFDSKGYLRKDGKKVLQNPRSAGTPRLVKLSGNQFYAGTYHHYMRNTLVKKLSQFYANRLELQPISFKNEDFPLRVEWDIYTTVDPPNYDLSNLWFYYKVFEDTLTELGIIPDDSIAFVTHPPAPRLFPIRKIKERKFVFRFYRDNRPAINNHQLWSYLRQQ